MIISTTHLIPGKKITKICGVAKGNTIRTRHIGKDILAIFRHIIGGEVNDYTKLMAEAREQSMDRMIKSGEEMGADAIIQMRFATSVPHGRSCRDASVWYSGNARR